MDHWVDRSILARSLRNSTLIKAMSIKPKAGQLSKPQTTGCRFSISTEPSKLTVHLGAVRYSIAMFPSKLRRKHLSTQLAATNPTKSQRKRAKSGVFQTLEMNVWESRCPKAIFATVLEYPTDQWREPSRLFHKCQHVLRYLIHKFMNARTL